MGKVITLCALFIGALSSIGGCSATTFDGSAHVENGRAGCDLKCKGQGMETTGMVYMGEYSDACICSVPARTGSLSTSVFAGGAAVAGGATGVVMQMRAQQQQQQRSMH